MKREQSPEEYWASVEKEVGEPVLAYVLARLPLASEGGSGFLTSAPRWGLVFLTGNTLYIDRSSTPNWFQRILQRGTGREDEEREAISISAMTRIVVPQPKHGIARIFASPETEVDIYYRGESTPLRLLLDRRGPTDSDFIARLEEIAARLQTQGEP